MVSKLYDPGGVVAKSRYRPQSNQKVELIRLFRSARQIAGEVERGRQILRGIAFGKIA